jgi:hypothetical protein
VDGIITATLTGYNSLKPEFGICHHTWIYINLASLKIAVIVLSKVWRNAGSAPEIVV